MSGSGRLSGKKGAKVQSIITKVNEREIVLDILLEDEKKPGHTHIIIGQALDKYLYLDKIQRSFISRLVQGSIERRLELDWIINQFSKTPVNRMKPVIRNIMRLSVYQLRYMNSVPASAACNEAVKLAGKRGFAQLAGFVNGVLRNISRNIDAVVYPSEATDYIKYASIHYSIPEWLIEHLEKECGNERERLCRLLEGYNSGKKTYIRCNCRLISPDRLKERLISEGVTVTDTPVEYAFAIDGYDYLSGLDSFNEGLYQVQDLSSILAGLAIHPEDGDYIVDICASPGGKCIHAAERAGHVRVEARDISESKVELIEDNILRMKADMVSTKVWDATIPDETLYENADILIADLPCSGIGILGRKPDIRYNITPEAMKELVGIQRRILEASSRYLKPGGTMIYSTCTINREENLDNVRWFTDNFPYKMISIEQDYPMLHQSTLKDGYVQLMPGIDGTDGFFIAKLQRVS